MKDVSREFELLQTNLSDDTVESVRMLSMVEKVVTCPVCKGLNVGYEFRTARDRLFGCSDCGLLFVPQSFGVNEQVLAIESLDRSHELSDSFAIASQAEQHLSRFKSRKLKSGSRFWVAGEGDRQFVDCATKNDFEPVDGSLGLIENDSVDACVLLGILGDAAYPLEQLLLVRKVLKPGGLLLITVPTLDCAQARRQKSQWNQLGSGRLTFFDRHGLSTLLVRAGYDNIMAWLEPNGLTVLCRKNADQKDRPRLSIVLPVYNERATFEQLIETVLEKTFDTMEREVRVWGYPHLLDAFLPTNRFGQFRDVQAPNKLTGRFRYYFNLHSLQRPCPRPDPDQQRVTEKGGFHLPQWGPQCLVAPWSDLFCAPLEAAGAQGHRGGYRPDRGPGRDFGEETAR